MIDNTDSFIERVILLMAKYGFIIGTFILSMLAKIHSIMRYQKRMSKLECATETLLSGLGSALVIYVLLELTLSKWLFCLLGGFSSLVIAPITKTITKEALPVLEIITTGFKNILTNWFKKQE